MLELERLAPEPREEWHRMLRFVGWNDAEVLAASRSVETLLQRGHELVVSTYDYLTRVPETAAILGWETGVDDTHLEERRRFFTIWLARTLGLDTSDEFAVYLFRAGKYHAGHGPRRIHTPPAYVTGSIGLVEAAFLRYMADARLPGDVMAPAMTAWSKYLSVQLNQMHLGYRIGRDMERGPLRVPITVFGRLRPLVGHERAEVRASAGANVADILRKFFNYYPQVRAEALDRVWRSEEKTDSLWIDVEPSYVPRDGWRVLLNGRDVRYGGGFDAPIQEGDEIALFPPGR